MTDIIHLEADAPALEVRDCSVGDCDRPTYCKSWCKAHYNRHYRTGTITNAPIGVFGGSWSKGSGVTYGAAHRRIYTERGPALEHDCATCGGPAAHWAYDHQDPNELTSPEGWAYSPDPNRYTALCVPCHSIFDSGRLI